MLGGMVDVLEKRRTAPIGDRGMVLNVVSWILLVTAVFTLVTRLAMKLALKKTGRKLGLDDVFIVLATLFSIGQTTAVSVESVHALGQHVSTLSYSQLQVFQKAEYAGCMLYMANMGCARISVCLLIKKILPGRTARYTALMFAGFTTLWTISGVLVTAFPCNLPRPWDFYGGKCFDLVNFINYIGVTNIVVEILLVVIPLFVWNLRLDCGSRCSVSLCFVARLSIVGAVAAQLHFFNSKSTSTDFTYDYWPTVLCIQIAQNLSIITANLPCLHPFILSILSGTTQADSLVFECKAKTEIKDYLRKKHFMLDSLSSQSSTTTTMREKELDLEYCRPLATWGLDRSSARLDSRQPARFPSNVATPVFGINPPENVFMRSVDIHIPPSRPTTSASHRSNLPPPPPTSLAQVGVLPAPEYDTDSSSDRDSGTSRSSRRRNSEYIFNRDKVISVPEAGPLYADEWRKYPPPDK